MPARLLRMDLGVDLGLARDGIEIGLAFGSRSLVELARIARFIETSVYAKGSLHRRPDGFGFSFQNPPLRLGAFDQVVVRVDGTEMAPATVWLRTGSGQPFRALDGVSSDTPLELLPGQGVEFQVRSGSPPPVGSPLTVRVQLRNVAIPPSVWIQFRDRVGPEGSS